MHHSFQALLFTSLLVLTGFLNSCNKGPTKFEAKEAEKGVVKIIAYDGKEESSGSGFHIGNGHIITNNHVIDKSSLKLLVVARKNSPTSIELQDATVHWTDKELDIAIIKVPEIECEGLTLCGAPVKKGSRAYAIGFPISAEISRRGGSQNLSSAEKDYYKLIVNKDKRGVIKDLNSELVQILDPTVSSGELRKTTKRKWQPNYSTKLEVIDHDVNIGHGNSGGPLFDHSGRVIGINTWGIGTVDDNVKCSSNITELIKVLEAQDISAKITSTPADDILSSGNGGTSWFLIILVLVLAGYIFITLRNKPRSETIAQYAGRVSGYTKFHKSNGKEDPSVAPQHGPRWEEGHIVSGQPPRQKPSLSQPVSPTEPHAWILQSDSNSPLRVQLPISKELLERHGYNLTIGRKAGVAHLIINNSSISKAHAILSFRKGNFAVIDQGSANGTIINGTTLNPQQRTRINSGDKLTLGEVTLRFNQNS